jgi:ppGpp synthetase/RelA/SpoT-type nucleotidyltranferase
VRVTLDQLRAWYLTERPKYIRIAKSVDRRLRGAVGKAHKPWEVAARHKDLASLLRKQMLKNYATPDRFTDLAGARITVTAPHERAEADEMIRKLFVIHGVQDKLESLAPSQIGYLGIHYDVSLRGGPRELGELHGLRCEIQLHTKAQSVWNDVSHKVLYKGFVDPPKNVARAVYRVMAILETVDDEVDRAYDAVMNSPGYEIAALINQVEALFFELAAPDAEYSRELTATIVPILLRAGYDSVDDARMRVGSFAADEREKLLEVFRYYHKSEDVSPLLFQPEILLLFERLQNAPLALESVWQETYPRELLEQLSSVWGALV